MEAYDPVEVASASNHDSGQEAKRVRAVARDLHDRLQAVSFVELRASS